MVNPQSNPEEAVMTEAPSQPMTPATMSDDQIGLSYAEVLYLLAMGPGPTAERTRETLLLDGIDDAEKISLIGASALMARGLIAFTEDGESIGAVDQALYIRFVLTNATRWTAFQATDGGEGGDTGFFIESPRGQLLVQPRAFDTWWFILLHPDAAGSDVLAATALGWGDSAPEMAVFIRSRTMTADRSFTIHVAEGSWSYAFGVTGEPEPEERREDVSRADTEAAVKRFADSVGQAS